MSARQLPPWRSRRFLKPGIPRIDWTNPLSLGLTGVYLPGLGMKIVRDLSGLGATLTCGASCTFKPTPEGMALDTSAQGTGGGCNGIASPAQQPPGASTLFWRGILLGAPASNEYFAGVTFNDGSAAPFGAYVLVYLNNGNVQAGLNTAGGNQWAVSMPATPGVVADYAQTFDADVNNFEGYANGAFISNNAATGLVQYGTSPQMVIGSSSTQPSANVQTLVVYTWDRALQGDNTPGSGVNASIESLHLDPYQLLIFPQDEIAAAWSPPVQPAPDHVLPSRPSITAY